MHKILKKRIISIILIIAIVLQNSYSLSAIAKEIEYDSRVLDGLFDELGSEAEKIKEGMEDAANPSRTLGWWRAIKDGFMWNRIYTEDNNVVYIENIMKNDILAY